MLFLIARIGVVVRHANSPNPSAGCMIKKGTRVVNNANSMIETKFSGYRSKYDKPKSMPTHNMPVR